MRCLLSMLVVLAAAPVHARQDTLTNRIGMTFVRIEPGSMVVGRFQPTCPTPPAADDVWTADDYARCEALAARDARPGFTVRIERPYYIGRYEVTQAQWRAVMGTDPSVFHGDRHPVDNVTWDDAQAFVARLNALDTTAVYRLPTAMEWEYAARAGADEAPTWAAIRAQAWIQDVDKGTTHPVGTKAPNAWGLYDTLGNVWEWTADYYNERFLPDPAPPSSGTVHVLRGGSFLSDVKNATPTTHAGGPGSGFDVGFRIVREAR